MWSIGKDARVRSKDENQARGGTETQVFLRHRQNKENWSHQTYSVKIQWDDQMTLIN